jgi:hypothetical protein
MPDQGKPVHPHWLSPPGNGHIGKWYATTDDLSAPGLFEAHQETFGVSGNDVPGCTSPGIVTESRTA